MPTIVDSLVMTLGLDGSNFEKGQKKSSEDLKKMKDEHAKVAKDLEESGKRAAEFFHKVRNEALLFFALFTGGMGLKDFVSEQLHSATAMLQMERMTGLGTSALQDYKNMLEEVGGTQADLNSTLESTSKIIGQQAYSGNSAEYEKFMVAGGGRLGNEGIEAYGTVGHPGNPAKIFQAWHDVLMLQQAQHKTMDEQRLLASSYGLNNKNLFDVLSNPNYNQNLAEHQAGSHVSHEDKEKLHNADVAWTKIKSRYADIGTHILSSLTPLFDKVAYELDRLATWFDANQDKVTAWIDNAVVAVKEFWHALDSVVEKLGGWKTVLVTLGALKLLSMSGALSALAVALQAVGIALNVVGGTGSAVGLLAKLAGLTFSGLVTWLLPLLALKGAESEADHANLLNRARMEGATHPENRDKTDAAIAAMTTEQKAALDAQRAKYKEQHPGYDPIRNPDSSNDEEAARAKDIVDNTARTAKATEEANAKRETEAQAKGEAVAGAIRKAFPPSNKDVDKKIADIMQQLQDEEGLSQKEAASAVGVWAGSENRPLDQKAKNPHSTAFGLAQWLQARQDDIKAHFHKDVHDMSLREQVHAWVWEARNSKNLPDKDFWEHFRQASTLEKGVRVMLSENEAPGPIAIAANFHGDLATANRALMLDNQRIALASANTTAAGAKQVAVGATHNNTDNSQTTTTEISVNGPITLPNVKNPADFLKEMKSLQTSNQMVMQANYGMIP